MKKIILYSFVSFALSGCASMIDNQTVDMTIKTPGAENAKCVIENQDYKYVAYSDETIKVMKSPHDLVARCMAPGNREQTVLVKREINKWVVANVANGFIPGTTYDFISRGGFDYPDEVVISFSGVPVKPYEPPDYMAKDLSSGNHKGSYTYNGPSTVRTNEDLSKTPYVLQKKSNDFSAPSSFDNYSSAPHPNQSSRPTVSYDPDEEDK